MNKGQLVDDVGFDAAITVIDTNFRAKLEKSIISTKLLTHKCQASCYEQNSEINPAEDCARNCFKPMMMIKKNVTKLIENEKEKLIKCKVDKKIHEKTSSPYYNSQIQGCLLEYSKRLMELKDEIEFIYEGYNKNFEKLFPEKKNKL